MSSIGPLRALDAPTSFDHEWSVTPAGVTGLSYGPGLSAPVGGVDGGPQFNGNYVRGKSNYYDGNTAAANTFDTKHYAQRVHEWQKGDTAPGLPVFVVHADLNPLTHHDRHSYQMFGVSQLNRRLKYDPAWRKKFGSLENAAAIKRAMSCIGIQQSKQTQLNDGIVWNEENNVIIRGRARIPDLALAMAGGAPVAEGDVIWMVLRRYIYTADDMTDVTTWAPDAQELVPTRKRTATVMEAPAPSTVELDPLELELDLVDAPTPAAAPVPVPPKEYYWAFDFWSTNSRVPPHPMMFTGDPNSDNPFVGDYEKIGLVTHVAKGHNSRTAEQVGLARRALHPVTRGVDYIEPLRQLHEVEIMFREG